MSSIRIEEANKATQSLKLHLLGLHNTVARKCIMRVGRRFSYPLAQHVLVNIGIATRSRNR